MSPALILGALVSIAGGLFLLLWSTDANASAAETPDQPGLLPDILPNDSNFFEYKEPLPVNAQANLRAFKSLIRYMEGGADPWDYDDLYGGGNFTNYYDHPYIMGTWKGVRLANGQLTTAAGAYQITVTTWRDIGGRDRFGSFDPSAQDAAADFLISRRGAMDDVLRGNFLRAVELCRNEWEAFDKALKGNYFITLANARSYYQSNGGEFA